MPLRLPAPEPGPAAPPFWRPPAGHFPEGAWFGLTTRLGGASEGAYSGLNLGLGVGDEEARVGLNRARVRTALGLGEDEPRRLHQVHGCRLVLPDEAPESADGFLLRAGDPWAAVSAADCAAVGIVARDGSVGTLLHSGWRGAAAGIATVAVERLAELGHGPRSLLAAVSPCLHACCFEVGPEVAALFPGEHLSLHRSGKQALDLPGVIAATLRRAGIPEESIHVAAECTSCAADRYYSHRRDRGITGRHWGLLALAGR
ncbi:MAG TPA: polyphenol oxidase family protein [Candidatus Eisenbacteria bacterium]